MTLTMPERPPWGNIATDEGAPTPKPPLPVSLQHRRTSLPSLRHRLYQQQEIQAMRQPQGIPSPPIRPARRIRTNALPRRTTAFPVIPSRRSYRAPGPLRPILCRHTANGLAHRRPFPAPSAPGPAHRLRTQLPTPRSARVPAPPRHSRAQRLHCTAADSQGIPNPVIPVLSRALRT